MAAPAVNNRAGAHEIETPMTVVYIDTEHDLILEHPDHGPCHRARIETTQDRLAVAAGQPCLVRRFAAVSLTLIQQIEPLALVIGGNRTDWAAYDNAYLDRILDIIRAAPVPILGICAGHQLIGRAHGADWALSAHCNRESSIPIQRSARDNARSMASSRSRLTRVVRYSTDCRRGPTSFSFTTGNSTISPPGSSSGHIHRGRRFRR
jgi:GMP synthase-like glutamine amidotransferase